MEAPPRHAPDRTPTVPLRALEIPMERQSSGFPRHHRHFITEIHLLRLHRFCCYGFVRVPLPNIDSSPPAACLLLSPQEWVASQTRSCFLPEGLVHFRREETEGPRNFDRRCVHRCTRS